jgi:hypothetical protein
MLSKLETNALLRQIDIKLAEATATLPDDVRHKVREHMIDKTVELKQWVQDNLA